MLNVERRVWTDTNYKYRKNNNCFYNTVEIYAMHIFKNSVEFNKTNSNNTH